jgi:TonB-linked SusC/RagA family outer membrane protein
MKKERKIISQRIYFSPITRILLFLFLFSVSTLSVFSQNTISVTGKVQDDVGEPLVGVTVQIVGAKTGTVTNAKGEYSINVKGDATLRFSFIGLEPQTVAVQGNKKIDVVLKETFNDMDEVVVVGYGKQTKANMTAAVSTITSKELEDRPISSIGQILQGLSTGVSIMRETANPGETPVINIRGIGTFNPAENGPYCLVDGVPTYIENVNPADIASISILKDAAATAIYGSSGANGVILITTKSANKEKISITFNSYLGSQSPTFLPKFVNAVDFMKIHNLQQENNGLAPLFSPDVISNYNRNMGTSDLYPNTDWFQQMMKPSYIYNQDLTVTGGTAKLKTFLSLGNFRNVGLIPNSSNDRKSVKITSTFTPSKYFKLNVGFNDLFTGLYQTSATSQGVFRSISTMPPIFNAKLQNGKYGAGASGINVLAQAEAGGTDNDVRESISIDLGASITPLTGLEISLSYSYRSNSYYRTNFKDQYQWYNNDGTLGGTLPTTRTFKPTYTHFYANQYRTSVSYRKKIKKNNFSILAGFDNSDTSIDVLTASRTNYLFSQFQQLDAGDVATVTNSGRHDLYANISAIGRFNYVYDDKYLFEANARYDESSILAPGYRDAFFPSVSAGWRVNKEKFMSGIKSISNLKLRASWGRTGRAVTPESNYYPYQSKVDIATQSVVLNESSQRGAAVTAWSDNTFTWEKSEMIDFGVDFGLFNNKLTGEFDYFDKQMTDGVYYKPAPLTSGLTRGYSNFIGLNNKGVEFSLRWNDKIGKLKYTIGLNFTDIVNKVTDMGGQPTVVLSGVAKSLGQEIDAWYVYKTDGLLTPEDIANPNLPKLAKAVAGNVKILDISGPDGVPDGKIDAAYDRSFTGTKFPRYQYSVPVNLQWKNFDAYVFLQGIGKSDMLINRFAQPVNITATSGNYLSFEKDSWDAETNPNGKVPAFGGTNGDANSDYYMKSNAYLRLKTVTLGYSLPTKLISKLGMSKARFYVSGENILTFADFYEGFDPETPVSSNVFNYPNVSTYTVGINLNF